MKKLFLLLALVSCFAIGCGTKKATQPAPSKTPETSAPADNTATTPPAEKTTN